MKSNRRHKKRLMNEINVVPYIDVMLVLLVIFMVTAPMMNPGQIDLPQVAKSSLPAVAPIEVIVNKDATLAYTNHAKGGTQAAILPAQLVALLQLKQREQPDQAVVISADKNVRYEEVINVMNMLQQQQIKKVGLLTKVKTE